MKFLNSSVPVYRIMYTPVKLFSLVGKNGFLQPVK